MYGKIKDPKLKVAINTGIIYFKMLVQILISLYTVRVLISNLSISGYGLFSLSAGLITIFTFLNSAMAVATQRYLSFYQVGCSSSMQSQVFFSSLVLHIGVAVLSISILLAIMPMLLDGFLNIHERDIGTAKLLYKYMLVSLFFTIISVPYVAAINSHENILVDSVVLIVSAGLKLLAALLLVNFNETDRLGIYGASLATVSGISFLIYYFYCRLNYNECRVLGFKKDFGLIKDMSFFAFWNLYANFCYVLNTQGLNVVLNMFYGTTVNAAYGIASQVNGQVRELSLSLIRALNPQIMKSEGMSNRERMIDLSFLASKFGFFLVSIVAVPLIIMMPQILDLWLKNVPKYAEELCIFLLIATMISQLTVGVNSAIQAIGRIKRFQLLVGSIAILALPVSYFVLKSGYSIKSAFIVIILVEVITTVIKIKIFSEISSVSVLQFIRLCILKSLLPLFIVVIVVIFIVNIREGMVFIGALLTPFIYIPLFYLIALNEKEKMHIKELVAKTKSKLWAMRS